MKEGTGWSVRCCEVKAQPSTRPHAVNTDECGQFDARIFSVGVNMCKRERELLLVKISAPGETTVDFLAVKPKMDDLGSSFRK